VERHFLIINNELNLVLPIRYDDKGEPIIYAYHSPISTEVFTANYRILVAANAAIWQRGSNYAAACASTANLALLDAATADAQERGIESQGPALLAQIKRLTYVLAPGANGYEQLPIDIAITRNIIDAADYNEVESSIVFFFLGYALLPRAARKVRCGRIASALNGSTTSLLPSEWIQSLPVSTPPSDTMEILSSLPS
jgi:hypothetical protein